MSLPALDLAARDIMSRTVVSVELDDRLLLVRELFEHRKVRHLMVVEAQRLVGMLSDRNMLRALSPYLGTVSEAKRDTATLNKRVHQVMELHPMSARPDTRLAEIATIFTEHQVECVPIINADREPIGLITWRDLLQAFVPSPPNVEPVC